jgi:hypothetical protein
MGYHGIDPHGWTVVYPYDSPFSRYPADQPVAVQNLIGHTDVDSTECPGALLYARLPALRDEVAADIAFYHDVRFMGDWNNDGVATPGAFRGGVFYLRNANNEGPVDKVVGFGNPGDVPVVGDWNGDGRDTVGVYRDGVFYLRNSETSGVAEVTFGYGNPGDIPVVGDWNGDGVDTIGVFRDGAFLLRNSNTTGVAEVRSPYGNPGDIPVVGDWNGDGTDTPGVFRAGTWYLRDSLTRATAERVVGYGNPGDTPTPYVVSTTLNPGGVTNPLTTRTWAIGVARGSYWFLSNSSSGGTGSNVFPF